MPLSSGLELSRRFYTEAVRPLLEEASPAIPSLRSTPGQRLRGARLRHPTLRRPRMGPPSPTLPPPPGRLPARGTHQTRTRRAPTPPTSPPPATATSVDAGHRRPRPPPHRSHPPLGWFTDALGFDPTSAITPWDWLATPTQLFAEVTGGAVFHDGLGELAPLRTALRWYPHDLWLHVLSCQWQRISQEEAFVGRCGEVGDALGSAVVAARLVRDLMHLLPT